MAGDEIGERYLCVACYPPIESGTDKREAGRLRGRFMLYQQRDREFILPVADNNTLNQ